MISFHPHGSLEHWPYLCACPHPSLGGIRTSFSHTALAMLHQRWTGKKAPVSERSPPLWSFTSLSYAFPQALPAQFSTHPSFQLLAHSFKPGFTKAILCDRHTVRRSG